MRQNVLVPRTLRRLTGPPIAAPRTSVRARMPFYALAALLLALALPTWTSFYLGSLRLTVYRVILLLCFGPCVHKVYSRRKANRPRFPDWCMLAFSILAAVALLANLGTSAIQTAGILGIETLGGYCLARCCIASAQDTFKFTRWLFFVVCCIAPLTIFECLAGHNLIDPRVPAISARFGLHRAYGPFDHPILNGVFCGLLLGMVWFCTSRKYQGVLLSLGRAVVVVAAAATSVSSGAMAILVSQVLLLIWNRVTTWLPRRWLALAGLLVLAYIGVDLTSSRPPLTVALYYLTFSPETAYGRMVIWDGGTAEIWRHPLLGNGTGEWNHPTWMSASMDNFWLYNAVVYGLPAALALMGAGAFIVWKLSHTTWERGSDVDRCRRGWLCTFAGLAIGAATVHLWNSAYVIFCVVLGSGVWMLDVSVASKATAVPTVTTRDRL